MIYTIPQSRTEATAQAVKVRVEKELIKLAEKDNKFLTDCGIEAVKFDAEVGLDGIRVVVLPDRTVKV